MKNNKLLFFCYIFCTTAIICTSSGGMGDFFFIKYNIPIRLLTFYVLYILITDFNGLIKAIIETKYLGFFIILMLISICRSNVPHITIATIISNFSMVSLFYLSTCHTIRYLINLNDIKRVLNVILIPFLILALLNILFFYLGFTKKALVAVDTSKMMQLIGFGNFSRVNFFLVDGVNSYGSLNGVSLIIAILGFIFNIYDRKFGAFAIFVFLLINFFTDCRGALGFALIATLVSLFIKQRKRLQLLSLMPYLGILAPLIFISLLPLLASSGYLSSMSRGGNDIATGSSRLVMWGYIYDDFQSLNNLQAFGYGDYGLIKTHAYNPIAQMFSSLKGDVVLNPQNSLIDIILDYGYFGMIVFGLILFSGFKKIKKNWNANPMFLTTLTALIIYLLLIGITEAVIGMYYNNAYTVFIYIFCLMSLVPNRVMIKVAITRN